MDKDNFCWVVTIKPCAHKNYDEESPNGCQNCPWLDWWTAFKTEEECNAEYLKQFPNNLNRR